MQADARIEQMVRTKHTDFIQSLKSDTPVEFNKSVAARFKDQLQRDGDIHILSEIVVNLEKLWALDWLSWIDKNIVKDLEASPESVARWLTHEIELNNIDSAKILQTVVFSYTAEMPNNAMLWDALARYRYFVGDIDEGDTLQAKAAEVDPSHSLVRCNLYRLVALHNYNRLDEAISLLENLTVEEPENKTLKHLALGFWGIVGNTQLVVETVDAMGGPSLITEPYHLYLYFSSLEAMGQLEKCYHECIQVLVEKPRCFSSFHVFRNVAHKLDRYDQVEELFLSPIAKYPTEPEAIEIAALSALDREDFASAKRLMDEIADQDSEIACRLNLTIETTIPGAVNPKTAYLKYRRLGVKHSGPEIQYVSFLFGSVKSKSELLECEQILLDAKDIGEGNIWFHRLYIQVKIALGKDVEAKVYFDEIAPYAQSSAPLAECRLYFEQKGKKECELQELWSKQLELGYHKAVHAQSDKPTPVSIPDTLNSSDILAFSCVFNAIEFLPKFLDYYRNLGVQHFIIVDNGSTDGSNQFLLDQPDVALFYQSGSFKAAAHGVRWINDLLQDFAVGKWAFFVDMDEHFIFPGLDEGRSLNELLGYADAKNFSSFPSFMLDMFATPQTCEFPGFLGHTHFDNSYFSFPSVRPPYMTVQGGVRARVTKRDFLITKSPLVKVTNNFRYLENNHTHTHLASADVSTAVLHYKFVGDANGRIEEAIQRKEHFMAARFYKDLERSFTGNGIEAICDTKTYQGTKQLEELGILKTSTEWQNFQLN